MHVLLCACFVPWRALVYSCVWLFFCARRPLPSHSTGSLSGSAPPFPKGVTCIGPCGKNSHSTPGSHEHEVPSLSLSLESHVCQVAPRTCVRCPSASLSEGVTLRKLLVHRRWLEPLLASCLSTGAGFEKEFVCNRGTLGVYAARPRARLPVHTLSTALLVCTHSLTRCPASGVLPSPLKRPAERSGATQELHQLRSARVETCPGKDWVNTGPRTGSTGSGTTRRQHKTSSLHTCEGGQMLLKA